MGLCINHHLPKRQKTDKFASYFTEEYPPRGKWMSINSGDRLSTVRPTLGPRTAKGKTRHYLKITSQQFQQRCDAGWPLDIAASLISHRVQVQLVVLNGDQLSTQPASVKTFWRVQTRAYQALLRNLLYQRNYCWISSINSNSVMHVCRFAENRSGTELF